MLTRLKYAGTYLQDIIVDYGVNGCVGIARVTDDARQLGTLVCMED